MTRLRLPASNRVVPFILLVFFFCLSAAISFAVPVITSVDPPLGTLSQDLEVTIEGSGFDENSRVVLFPDSGNRMRILGSEETGFYTRNVIVACNTAYVTAYSSLHVIDVSNSKVPELKTTVTLPGMGMALDVADGMVYVVVEQHGLLIFDLTDSYKPILIGEVGIPSGDNYGHYGISLAGKIAYVANGSSGLQVINTADPRHPVLGGHVTVSGYASGVSVSGHLAFVSVLDYGLRVVDVSDPTDPVVIGSVRTPGSFTMDVSVSSQTAYVADGDGGLQVVDVSDPHHPVIIGAVSTSGLNWRIAVSNTTVYMVTPGFGLHAIDVSDAGNPVLMGSIRTSEGAADVALANNLAYVAANTLEVIDVSNITRSGIISSLPSTSWTEGVTVENSTAYVTHFDGLQVVDVSNPAQPVITAFVPSPAIPQAVVVQNNIAYVADDWGLQVIDVTAGKPPESMGWVEIGWSLDPWDVEVVGDIAYVAAYEYGLQVVNVSNPEAPFIIASMPTSTGVSAARGITVAGSIAYIADEKEGLCIIDVADPAAPALITSIQPPGSGGTMGVSVAGNMAYLAVEDGGLQLVDISVSSTPVLRGSLGIQGLQGYDVVTADQTAYIAALWRGVQAVDVSDPAEPTLLAAVDTPGYASGLTIVDGILYIADGNAGFCAVAAPVEIVPHPVITPSVMTATLSVDFKGDYTIRVFDSSGSAAQPGAVTFMEALPKSKAVIVAGYGPHSSNKLWDETLLNASHAWNVLFEQGYLQENIRYLSPVTVDVNDDGIPDVHGDATLANFENTLTSWAADVDDLVLYLVGHGGKNSFVMKHSDTVHEVLTAGVLAGWLNSLQENTVKRVVCVYEACYSGSFVDAMTLDQGAGFERMLLTSSTSDQVSILGNKGYTSFSHRFWESVYEQGNLVQAFTNASVLMAGFGQTSWLDGNCDGQPNTPADSAVEIAIGRGYSFQTPLKPSISCSSPSRTLTGTSSAILWAKVVAVAPVTRVWAEIIPPDYNPLLPDAAELPTVELAYSRAGKRYEGSYFDFNRPGMYRVALYAVDNEQTISLPTVSTVTVAAFPWSLFIPAVSGGQQQ